MRLVMTVLARDEADVLDAQIRYHLDAGVEFVLATDHRSSDGTRELLEEFEREGVLRLIREESEWVRQGAWVTRMARLAAREHGADWVLNADADEFWWPREGSLVDVLGAIPAGYGTVGALVRPFVPRPDDDRPFWERLTVRIAAAAAINDPATPYRAVRHVVHRAHPEATVSQGGHRVTGVPGRPLTEWYPVEVLHFPFRSRAQLEAKHAKTLAAWRGNLRGDLARARRHAQAGRARAFHEEVVVGDELLARGLRSGTLVEDTRLRDRLRAIGSAPGAGAPFPRPTPAEEAGLALDAAVLGEAELVRLQRRADELAARLARLGRR